MINDKSPVMVKGEGYIEIFAWETQTGYALHIINYNNPNMTRPSTRQFYPIGEQSIRMELPQSVKIAKVELLRAEKQISFKQVGNIVDFVIPSVEDFEIAALYI